MFGLSLLNPWLVGGSALVAVPILIHLLSKRRFKTVYWAAMEFLLEANRRNRRRIRLENLLLLLLRCLAVILIALMVARPILQPSGLIAALPAIATERIVVLDDSPSMGATLASRTAFEQSVAAVGAFLTDVAKDHPSDTLTLLLTSRPDRPLVVGQPLDPSRAQDTLQLLSKLQPSDRSSHFAAVFSALETLLANQQGRLNRSVYLVSDFRRSDWETASTPQPASSRDLLQRLRELADKTTGMVLADMGAEGGDNVSVLSIRPADHLLVAGVESRFEVVIANHGGSALRDIDVVFHPQDAPEFRARLDQLKSGESASVPFTFTFPKPGSYSIEARVGPDVLPADNTARYAAQIAPAVGVLLVDGDTSAVARGGGTFLLEHAIAPPGEISSGNRADVISDSQFDATPLEQYQVVVLSNVYSISSERAKTLEAWVHAGGGLVVFLGDQIDAQLYNDRLYRDAKGVLPVKLLQSRGDERKQTWFGPVINASHSPILRVFEGAQNPFLRDIKVFRWWTSVPLVATGDAAGSAVVLASLTDPENSPWIVERSLGLGRVLLFSTSADTSWNNWPSDASYVVTMLEAMRRLARSDSHSGDQAVGQPIQMSLDPARYMPTVQVTPPWGEPTSLQAAPGPDGRLAVQYDDTGRAGFYRLLLSPRDAAAEPRIAAVNIEPGEGRLERMSATGIAVESGSPRVEAQQGRLMVSGVIGASGLELWRPILLALVLVLGVEQTLAWTFGRRR